MPATATLPLISADVAVQVTKGDTLVSSYGGRVRWLWSYAVQIHNQSEFRIQLKGRRLEIKGGITENVPFQKTAFAPSVGGEQRVLGPGERWSYPAAVVTDDLRPPTVRGTFDGVDLDRQARVFIELPCFTFDDASTYPLARDELVLRPGDAERLCEAIDLYEFTRQSGYGALFRPDRIKVSERGFSLINQYLIDYFRQNRGKSIEVDFSPLLPRRYQDRPRTLRVIDHYFLKSDIKTNSLILSYVLTYNCWELTKTKSADAGLVQQLGDLYRSHGFRLVAKELFRLASPEERAQLTGMVAAEQFNLAAGLESKPILSVLDRAAFLESSTLHQWDFSSDLAPSQFMRTHFGKWFELGLTIDDIATEQPDLVREYKQEVAANPRHRIRALSRPHTFPADTPPRMRKDERRVALLSEAERIQRRKREQKKKAAYRAKHKPS